MLLILCGDIELNPGPQGSHSLDYVHLNVNGLKEKLDIVISHLASYDVVCFTESHLNPLVESDDLRIPGFHDIKRRDRTVGSWGGGGGVGVYMKCSIAYKRRLDLESPDLENLWIEIYDVEPSCSV